MNLGILPKLIIIQLFLLFVQFSIGMWNNLFALVPLDGPFKFFVYSGGIEVLAHIINGALVLALGLTIVWFSFKTKSSLAFRLSILAVVFTISAIANGTAFLEIFLFSSLYSIDNYFSMAMAISFLVTFSALFSELFVVKRDGSLPET